jgi:integrase
LRGINRLSARAVTLAKASARPLMLHDGQGLYLRVTPSGAKSWVLRYQRGGKRHDLGLGSYPLFSLADARQRANEKRRLLADGIDPRRRPHDKALTLAEIAERYIEAQEPGWRNRRSESQWRSSLATYVYPLIGEMPVRAIDAAAVLRVLQPIWATKNETASRVRGRLEAIIDYSATLGLREAGLNPARWRGNLSNALPRPAKVQRAEHLAAMPHAELPAFLAKLCDRQSIDALALEYLILTATRTGEVLQARWDEIKGDVWTVPADRMKGGRAHRVPLSDAALVVLATMREFQRGPYIFPGRSGAISKASMHHLLRTKLQSTYTVHGFRSTFRDWAAEQTAFPREIAEMSLGHVVGSDVERAYQRSDLFEKRRELMQAWADYCDPLAGLADIM